MSEKVKHLLITLMICSVLAVSPGISGSDCGTEGGSSDWFVYAAEETDGEDSPQSSFDYKNYGSPKIYRNMLMLKMPDVYRKLSKDIDDDETLPIPGTLVTCTGSGGSEMTDTYVPQGICSTGDYWLVTAYDAGKKYPSVIYVIDSGEKRLVSTVSLPNKYHLGGIAFDGERIWITGDTSDRYKGQPFVQYITYDYLIGLIRKSITQVSKNAISEKVFIKNRPSFLEYEAGRLWVGTYIGTKETKEGYIYGYPVNGSGDGELLNTTIFSVITSIDSSAQGMDIDDDYLYVSSSYKGDSPGIKSSFVTKYEISPVINGAPYLDAEYREITRIEVPKMNEEIFIEDDLMHINFESSASKWKKPVIRTDRILAVSKPLW